MYSYNWVIQEKKDFVLGVGADDTWDDVGTKNSASSEIIKLSPERKV